MNKLKLGLVAVLLVNLVGCAAISEKKANEIINSNHVVIYKVTHANTDAKKSVDYLLSGKENAPNGKSLIESLGGKDEVVKNYYWNGGLLKYTYSKTFGAGVLTPKSLKIENGDLVMGQYQGAEGALKLIKIVARSGEKDKDCYWDGSGVICPKENWDYRKDLPEAMK